MSALSKQEAVSINLIHQSINNGLEALAKAQSQQDLVDALRLTHTAAGMLRDKMLELLEREHKT